jgi:hypothetical protein
MKDIKLPIVKSKARKDRRLSMEDYLEFVLFNLKHTVDMVSARKLARKAAINVPFVFK